MHSIHVLGRVLVAIFVCLRLFCECNEPLRQTNLVLIMFDDLRPELPFYGRKHVIAPNFERLAAKSVIFDHAFCQVAVCNPSRNSLLTGLRPDTTGSYNFDRGFGPHLIFPSQLVNSGYNTAAAGKIAHWVDGGKNIWNFDHWENGWYDYQNTESRYMNSSVMPDKVRPLHKFRDHEFASKSVEQIRKMAAKPNFFMAAVGFKLPHLDLHVPHKFFELYKNKKEAWKMTKKELKYPSSVSEISYRCCAEGRFRFMREEGALPHNRSFPLMDINKALPNEMHDDLMMGYLAGISYLDTQVGRILDVLDELHLWENTTVVLTSDHGMHNGEKGLWEKWTLFEEAVRIPLLIAHPQSPFKGQHYAPPVESVDVYATLNELLRLPKTREAACKDAHCQRLDGKSLAPVVLGTVPVVPASDAAPASAAASVVAATGSKARNLRGGRDLIRELSSKKGLAGDSTLMTTVPAGPGLVMATFAHDFAISQVIRCAPKDRIPNPATAPHRQRTPEHKEQREAASPRSAMWNDCDTRKHNNNEMSLLGYSMRTLEYRYTAYYPFNRTIQRPELAAGLNTVPYEEELYDHKNETLSDFTHRETVNLAYRPSYAVVIAHLRTKLAEFVFKTFANKSPHY